MEERLDALAKGAADGMSRRQVLRLAGAGLGATLLSLLTGRRASAGHCPEGGAHCGGACCPAGTKCCKIRGEHFCCETGGLVNVECGSLLANCVRVGL